MPSIPQSLLWISLVVLWLFVLVPMLISKRESVRRTSDVALATRVLNSGKSRLLKRRGPSAGHHHDPEWRPAGGGFENLADDEESVRSVVVVKAVADQAEPDYLDVDVVDEDSGALPVGGVRSVENEQPSLFDQADDPATDQLPVADERQAADADACSAQAVEAGSSEAKEDLQRSRAAAVDDSDVDNSGVDDSGVDGSDSDAGRADGRGADEHGADDRSADNSADEESAGPASAARGNRARRFESATAAAVSARKYRFRKRVLMVMAVLMLFTAVLSVTGSSEYWWTCGTVTGVTVLYLAYLRRQTRIEAQVRRRRQQRVARSRLGVENTRDRDFDVVPSRLRRPGAAVLEIDDEDPVFEHLDEVAFARHYDLPRAAGQ
jgi:hypothetical protein